MKHYITIEVNEKSKELIDQLTKHEYRALIGNMARGLEHTMRNEDICYVACPICGKDSIYQILKINKDKDSGLYKCRHCNNGSLPYLWSKHLPYTTTDTSISYDRTSIGFEISEDARKVLRYAEYDKEQLDKELKNALNTFLEERGLRFYNCPNCGVRSIAQLLDKINPKNWHCNMCEETSDPMEWIIATKEREGKQ